jgi:hypothetical protein
MSTFGSVGRHRGVENEGSAYEMPDARHPPRCSHFGVCDQPEDTNITSHPPVRLSHFVQQPCSFRWSALLATPPVPFTEAKDPRQSPEGLKAAL